MKNPYMSMWLSAANQMTGPVRGQMASEMSKAQTQIMREWQHMWIEAWMTMMFPMLAWEKMGRK